MFSVTPKFQNEQSINMVTFPTINTTRMLELVMPYVDRAEKLVSRCISDEDLWLKIGDMALLLRVMVLTEPKYWRPILVWPICHSFC